MLYILIDTLISTGIQSDRVAKIGNDIRASSSGVDVRGAIFLMNDMVTSEGILFAFSAFFRSDSLVRFQIWRPVSSDDMTAGSEGNAYTLVVELRTIPSVINMREDVSKFLIILVIIITIIIIIIIIIHYA